RNPASATRSASVKAGWIVASAVDGAAVVIGHLPAGLRPGGWASSAPAIKRKPTVSRATRSRDATNGRAFRRGGPSQGMLHTSEYCLSSEREQQPAHAQIVQCGAALVTSASPTI